MSSKSNTVFITSSEAEPVFFLASSSKATFNRESLRNVNLPYNDNYQFSYLLQEDGFFLLQEDGFKIIL